MWQYWFSHKSLEIYEYDAREPVIMANARLTSTTVIYKQPGERIPVGMDFTNILAGDDTITSVPYITAVPSGDLSLDNISVLSNIVYVTVGSGLHSKDYRLDFQVGTSDGYTYIADGILKVRDR